MKLAGKLGLKNEDSAASKILTKKSQADLKELKQLKGAEFDEEYLEDQALIHKLLLETIENVLIRSADHQELKTMLTKAQGKVAPHLDACTPAGKQIRRITPSFASRLWPVNTGHFS